MSDLQGPLIDPERGLPISIFWASSLATWLALLSIFGGMFAGWPAVSLTALGLYGLAAFTVLKCPACGSSSVAHWLGGKGWLAAYFNNPFVMPGRCNRCGLDFHQHHLLQAPTEEQRRAWVEREQTL